MARLEHGFGPFYDGKSEILILGSFPSAKSREASFYYAHPQNRFWRVLAACFDDDVPRSLEGKHDFLRMHRLALWDVVESCEIKGSSDASIRDVVPADVPRVCGEAPIRRVILNGRTAERYFYRCFPGFALPAVTAPSTSPANAVWTFDRLLEAWRAAIYS